MLFYAITALINTITSIFFGLFVYFKNKKVSLNQIFALFCLSVAIWSSFYFVWLIFGTTKSITLFFARALNVAAVFIPITYFHFITVFLNIYQKKKKLVIWGYFFSLFLFISGFTSLFVKNVEPELLFPWYAKAGITYHFFVLMFFGYVVYTWYLMFKAIKISTGIKKIQIKYILTGTLIGFIGGSTNFFLVYDIPIPPFGNGLVVFYIILSAFAVIKYHLFEIRTLITEILVGAIGLTLLIQSILAETFLLKVLGFSIFALFSVFGYLLIKSVLNEIKRMKELERLTLQLEQANIKLKKLDKAKSEFVSIASHQLRAPLSVIKGYVSMILEGTYGKLTKKIERPMENVYKSNERLLKLINNLLNISRIEAGKIEMKLEKISLSDVITDVIQELKIKTEDKNLYLKFEKSEKPLPKILIDREKIRQVILNIIDNAINYTKKGGIVINVKRQASSIKS